MRSVTIYGAETSRYEYFKYNLENFVKENKLDVKIKEVKDVNTLIADHVMSIPTLRVNNHMDIVYNEEKGIEDFLNEAKNNLMMEFAPDRLSKFLVPIDFSDPSLNAFQYALDMAKSIGATIDLMHVHHPAPVVVDGVVIVDEFSSDNRKEALKKIALDTNMSSNRKYQDSEELAMVKPIYLEGLAGDEIINRSTKMDAVIMGLTGTSETLKLLLGSVSTKVSSKAKCPVILVPDDYLYRPIKKIVFGHSKTKYDGNTINRLANLAKDFDASLHFVHVKDGSNYDTSEINAYMEHMLPDIEFTFDIIDAENIGMGINNYANDIDAQLIILSKKQKNILEKLFTKSQTQSAAANAIMPIMIMHKEDHGCKCGGLCKKSEDGLCDH